MADEDLGLRPLETSDDSDLGLRSLDAPTSAPSPTLTTAARIVPTIVGAVGGSLLGPWGTAGGGALGSALGELIAQKMEERSSPGQVALSAALGAIPGIPLAKGLSTAARLGIRAAEGGGIAGAGQIASNVIEGQPALASVPTAVGTGLPLGALGGVVERALLNRTHTTGLPINPNQTTPEGFRPLGVQEELFPVVDQRPAMAARIAALEAQQKTLKSDLKFKTAEPGTQRALDLDIPPTVDPQMNAPALPKPFVLEQSELSELIKLSRTSGDDAVKYMERLRALRGPASAQAPYLTQLGSRISGATQAFMPESAQDLGHKAALMFKGIAQESSKTIEDLGIRGKELVRRTNVAYDNFNAQRAAAIDGPQGVAYVAGKERLNLTPAERRNVFDVREGTASAMNPRVSHVAQLIEAQQQAVAQRAQRLELTISDPVTREAVPWQARPNFMPHFTDWDRVMGDKARKTRAITEIQQQETKLQGRAVTAVEAEDILKQMRRHSRQEYGHLEIARRYSLTDHEHDAIAAHTRYMNDALKRLNEVEQFGPKFEKARDLVAGLGQETGDDASMWMAKTYLEKVTGKNLYGEDVNPLLGPLSSAVRGIQTGLKLGQAVIANASQSVMTDMVVGHGNLVRGFQAARTQHGKEFGRLAGATIDQTMRDMESTIGRNPFANAVLKYTGFTSVEQYNRMLAANSGRAFAQDLVEKLRTGTPGTGDELKRHLRKMGIEPMDVVGRGYKLTLDEELKAARSVIQRTQFSVRPQDLPLFWTGPFGSLVTQFSSFGFKAAKAINDDLLHEAYKGNFKPLARMALLAPIAGEVVRDVQHFTKGKEQKDRPTGLARLADNASGVGAFGLFADAAISGSRGELGVARRIMGPTVSDAAVFGGAVLSGNWKQLGKQTAQNVPVIGSPLRNALFPPKEED